jgi:predicted CoA-binding protein
MKRTLIIGASENTERYSYKAMISLRQKKHPVVGLGSKKGKVGDVEIKIGYPELKNIDTVSIYLNPIRQKNFYNYILNLKPKRIVLNPGTENPDFYSLAEKKGVEVKEACTLVLLSTNQY